MSVPQIISFSEFKERFYSRFPSLDIFDCGQINLVKVILDGLKVNYSSRGVISHSMNRSARFYSLKLLLRRIKCKLSGNENHHNGLADLVKLVSRDYLFIDHSNRLVKGANGELVSIYFHKVLNQIGRKNVALINENSFTNNSDFDFVVGNYSRYIKARPLDSHEQNFLRELIIFYKRIQHHFNENERLNIGFAIEKYFGDYRLWRYILKILPQKKIVILCHYHHEGAIHAMKDVGREIIEMQHGLISVHDLFYCLPENIISVKWKALFPDYILVYGNYWKNVLMKGFEFSVDQIKVMGYYLFSPEENESTNLLEIKKWIGEHKVVLITTQTFGHEIFIKYIKWLSNDIQNRNLNWIIIVKLHPAEEIGLYSDLNTLKGVKIVNESLAYLFPLANIHISIYSTTLYEALRYRLKNYSLDVEPALVEYVNEIVQGGIAIRINGSTNPIDLEVFCEEEKDNEYYFERFECQKLINFLK